MRPTPEEIAEAREWLGYAVRGCSVGGRNEEMIRVLIAATEPPTDEEIDKWRHSYKYAVTPRAVLENFLGRRKHNALEERKSRPYINNMIIDQSRLAVAVEYANKLLGRDVSLEWGAISLTEDFTDGMAPQWTWGAAVRAHYDASETKA